MLLSALIVAFETVSIEGALNIVDLNLYLVSSLPSIIGGLILMGASARSTRSFIVGLGRRSWGVLIAICGLAAAGVIFWFDAVSRIGASKESILGSGSSEVLFVVILSAAFLRERLTRLEGVGSGLVILGVILVLANTQSFEFSIGVGELEAIFSSLLLAISIVLVTSLLKEHKLTPLSGIELFVSGAMVLAFSAAAGWITYPGADGWVLLLLLGLFPAVGLLTYNAGLPKIGASLTSVLFALTGIITVGVQLLILLIAPDADIILPQSVPLAVLGGGVAFIGVYLLNRKKTAEDGI